jgi:hypothetical protein
MTDPEVTDAAGTRRGPGRPKSPEVEARLHVSMPQSLKDQLEKIQHWAHKSSVSEVVKDALVLYAAAVDVHKNGGHVVFRDEKGGEQTLLLFLTPHSRPQP